MKKSIKLVVATVIMAVLLWLIYRTFRETDWRAVFVQIREVGVGWLLLAAVLVLATFLMRVQRWTYIVKEVIEQIIANGHVARSWIGESLQPMTAKTDDPNLKGVLVADVDRLSPAYEAGLQPGDTMLSIDGISTDCRFEEDLPPVRKLISAIPVGKEIVVKVRRDGQEKDIRVTTIEKSQLKGTQAEFSEWGFTAVDLTPAMVRFAQLPSRQGILVTGTQVGSIAANARLQPEDIILRVDGINVLNIDAFREVYKTLVESRKRLVMLDVKRGALTRFTLVKQEGEASPPAAETLEPGSADTEEGDNNHGN